MWTGPPKALGTPKPMSSIRTSEHVRRARGRLHLEARRRRRLADVELRDRRVARLRDRQHRAVQRRGRRRPPTAAGAGGFAPEQAAVTSKAPAAVAASQVFSLFEVSSLCSSPSCWHHVGRSGVEPQTPSMQPGCSRSSLQDRCRGSAAAMASSASSRTPIELSLRAARRPAPRVGPRTRRTGRDAARRSTCRPSSLFSAAEPTRRKCTEFLERRQAVKRGKGSSVAPARIEQCGPA